MVLTVETELLFTDARANWPIALSRKIFFGFSFGFSFGSKIGSNPLLKSPPPHLHSKSRSVVLQLYEWEDVRLIGNFPSCHFLPRLDLNSPLSPIINSLLVLTITLSTHSLSHGVT